MLVVRDIVLGLFVDFPALRLFKDHALEAVALAWMAYRGRGLDDDQFFMDMLSIEGRIALAGSTLGLIAGRCCGCDSAAVEAGQRRAAGLGA